MEHMDRMCTFDSTHSQRTTLGISDAVACLACCHVRVGHQGEQIIISLLKVISKCIPKTIAKQLLILVPADVVMQAAR